jgi:hypothetical protein
MTERVEHPDPRQHLLRFLKGYPMHFIVVNIDKQEYFRPIALDADHGSKYWGIVESTGVFNSRWLLFLAHLIERGATAEQHFPRQGSWASDRVVIVRGDDQSDLFLSEDEVAFKVLGAKTVTPYKHVREQFADITADLKGWGPCPSWRRESAFTQLTRPEEYVRTDS